MSTVRTSDHIFFFGRTSVFSQFYACKFADENGITYRCGEQYMHYQKALIFGDGEIADKILNETSPIIMKKLGRKVKGFKDSVWVKHREKIVRTGTLLKFEQNEKLRRLLLSSGKRKFAEASPSDKIWGIGRDLHTACNYKAPWRGSNLLGKILSSVRDELLEKERR